MQLERRTVGDVMVVAVGDEVDVASIPTLHQALNRAIDEATAVALDLDGALLVDDAALGIIVGAAARARRHGVQFSVVCTDQRLRDRLADTRVDRIVDVVDRLTP
jgi:anti-anti-sigma factor